MKSQILWSSNPASIYYLFQRSQGSYWASLRFNFPICKNKRRIFAHYQNASKLPDKIQNICTLLSFIKGVIIIITIIVTLRQRRPTMKFTAISRVEEWLLPTCIKNKHKGNRKVWLPWMSASQIKYKIVGFFCGCCSLWVLFVCFVFSGGRGGRTACEKRTIFCFHCKDSG